ncbi:MAG: serine/threonine protein kinase [Thermoactinospora sp.]|nr:serine/threonine protein kinase [Thermoactinospora sp.]
MHVNERSLIGQEVAGYYIEDVIGKGGMAVVYLALDPRLSRRVALKILNPILSVDDRFRQRFILESRTVASIEHPNIIPIYEANADAGGVLYIAMRYVEGLDLRRFIHERGPLPVGHALPLFAQMAAALDVAHRHDLIHRDVKPANILVAGDHVYLTDFGITKHRTSISGLTQTDQFIGTPRYMAPEQINKEVIDGRCDQYALACVVYECLTGRLPFERDNDIALLWAHLAESPAPLSQLRPELPPAVDAVMMRALAKAPEQRYSSCSAFVTALRDAISGIAPATAPTLGTVPAVPKPPGRLPIILVSVVGALAAVALILLLALGGLGGGSEPEWTAYKGNPGAPVAYEHPADWTVRTHEDLFSVASPKAQEFETLFLAGVGADWTPVSALMKSEPESVTGLYVQLADGIDYNADAAQLKGALDTILPGEVEIGVKPVTDSLGTTTAARRFEGTMVDRKSRTSSLSFTGYVVDRPGKRLLMLYFCAATACSDTTQERIRSSSRLT